MAEKNIFKNYLFWASCFAVLNVLMYFLIGKFWIGGSSFLPMIGVIGKEGAETAFLFAFIVNIGIIIGSLVSSIKYTSAEVISLIDAVEYRDKELKRMLRHHLEKNSQNKIKFLDKIDDLEKILK